MPSGVHTREAVSGDSVTDLGPLLDAILAFEAESRLRPPDTKQLPELTNRGFHLSQRYRGALEAHGHNAFGPRANFQELHAWIEHNPGITPKIDVMAIKHPITDVDMIAYIMATQRYPAFYADWARFLVNQPAALRQHGSIVALGSTLIAPANREYHGALIERVPYALFEPFLSRTGILDACEVVTPFPAGTGFLTIDLR